MKRNNNLTIKSFTKKFKTTQPHWTGKKVNNNAINELKSARSLDKKRATNVEVQEAKAMASYMFPKINKPEN